MKQYITLVRDLIGTMRKEGYGRQESVQIYAGTEAFRGLVDEADGLPRQAERHVQTEELKVGGPTKAAFGETPDSYETYDILNLDGMALLEDPRLGSCEILIVDEDGLYPDSSVAVEHPACIQKERILLAGEQTVCENCGTRDELVVEGDEGEPYCSIKCLNEAYRP